MINGVEDSLLKYPKLVGFVPQEDIMHRDCTVEEVCLCNMFIVNRLAVLILIFIRI